VIVSIIKRESIATTGAWRHCRKSGHNLFVIFIAPETPKCFCGNLSEAAQILGEIELPDQLSLPIGGKDMTSLLSPVITRIILILMKGGLDGKADTT
jgi:hypothetical protein